VKNRKVLFVLLALMMIAAVSAQDMKIGFIYSEQIMIEYQEAVDAMRKLEAEARELQKIYQEMQVDYQKLIEDYEKRKLVSSDAWKNQKQREILDKERQLQEYQIDKFGQEGEIYQKEAEYLGPVLDKINETLKKVGDARNYDYVFDASKGSIVYADEKHNLTGVILEELKKSR
jgi:outer membrane protein